MYFNLLIILVVTAVSSQKCSEIFECKSCLGQGIMCVWVVPVGTRAGNCIEHNQFGVQRVKLSFRTTHMCRRYESYLGKFSIQLNDDESIHARPSNTSTLPQATKNLSSSTTSTATTAMTTRLTSTSSTTAGPTTTRSTSTSSTPAGPTTTRSTSTSSTTAGPTTTSSTKPKASTTRPNHTSPTTARPTPTTPTSPRQTPTTLTTTVPTTTLPTSQTTTSYTIAQPEIKQNCARQRSTAKKVTDRKYSSMIESPITSAFVGEKVYISQPDLAGVKQDNHTNLSCQGWIRNIETKFMVSLCRAVGFGKQLVIQTGNDELFKWLLAFPVNVNFKFFTSLQYKNRNG